MKYTRSLLAIAVLATISIPASAASLNYQLDGVDKAKLFLLIPIL